MAENKLFIQSNNDFLSNKISEIMKKYNKEDIDISNLDLSSPLFNIIKKNKQENSESENTIISKPTLESRISALEEAITDIILSQMEV